MNRRDPLPDNMFDDDDEDEGLNDYIEVLKAVVGGLDLAIDALMGNSVDGVGTAPRNNGRHGRTGAGRKLDG